MYNIYKLNNNVIKVNITVSPQNADCYEPTRT